MLVFCDDRRKGGMSGGLDRVRGLELARCHGGRAGGMILSDPGAEVTGSKSRAAG